MYYHVLGTKIIILFIERQTEGCMQDAISKTKTLFTRGRNPTAQFQYSVFTEYSIKQAVSLSSKDVGSVPIFVIFVFP